MRKLKLQMQVSVDGYVAGPKGQLDWMTWDMGDELHNFITEIAESCDTILMGRKMTDGFTKYWESVKPDSPEFSFAKMMVDYPKIIFSKTLKTMSGKNTIVENGDLVAAVNKLKNQNGRDILVYGGATFVSALIKNNLIDELNLFVNPTAIGKGMEIFLQRTNLKHTDSKAYKCGIVVNQYVPIK